LNDKYLVLEEIRSIPHGTEYFVRSIIDNSTLVARVFHDFSLRSEAEYAGLEDQFFKARELESDRLQKPVELFKYLLSGQEFMFPVLVLAYPLGQSLRSFMKSQEYGIIPESTAGKIGFQLAEQMEILHKSGFTHGSLCPDSVYWDAENETVFVVQIPFLTGLEGPIFNEETNQKFYAAHEVWEGAEFNPGTDIYAFGCLLHEMLEGGPPYLGVDQKLEHFYADCPGLSGISGSMNSMILSCLNKKPQQRPKSFQLIGKKLKSYQKAKASVASGKKGGGSSILILLLLVAGGGGGWYAYNEFVEKPKKLQAQKKTASAPKPKVMVEEGVESEPLAEAVDVPNMVFYAGGEFQMGSPKGFADASFVHTVKLSPFYLDKTEVTHQEYFDFVQSGMGLPPVSKNPRFSLWKNEAPLPTVLRQPVIHVPWEMARAYCNSLEKRLPTEAEWEFAARGKESRDWPWGQDDPHPVKAQFDMEWSGDQTIYEVDFFKSGVNPEGVFNLIGGVREWVQDWYSPDYYESSPLENPTGPKSGDMRVIRGSSWEQAAEPLYSRDFMAPEDSDNLTGFRCAKSL
jgi:formylglycine-generating enzyme required for sulfatase activity